MWPKDWKIRLKYGKLHTNFKHYTLIADALVSEIDADYNCPPGNAFVSLKIWAESDDEAVNILVDLGERIGYALKDKIEIFDTDPEEAPPVNDRPRAYDLRFTPYKG